MNVDDLSMRAWDDLTRSEQAIVIRKMAAEGWTDHGLANVTGLAVSMIREILAEHS